MCVSLETVETIRESVRLVKCWVGYSWHRERAGSFSENASVRAWVLSRLKLGQKGSVAVYRLKRALGPGSGVW